MAYLGFQTGARSFRPRKAMSEGAQQGNKWRGIEYFQLGMAILCGTVAAILDNAQWYCLLWFRPILLAIVEPLENTSITITMIECAAISYRQLDRKMFPPDTF
jgi:hypothetical protein